MKKQTDLFDQAAGIAPGGRQVDLDQVIEEKSLARAIAEGDKETEADLMKRAKAGEVIRIM